MKKKLRHATTTDYPVVKEGVLSRNTGLRGTSPIYAVVRGGDFEYYSDRNAWLERREPKGVVELFCCRLDSIADITSKPLTLGLTPSESEQKFVFFCVNAQEQKSWHDCIASEISALFPSEFGLRSEKERDDALGSPESSIKRELSDPLDLDYKTEDLSSSPTPPIAEDPRSLRFSEWVSAHITSRKDVSTLFRAVAKQISKIAMGTDSSASCTCACSCCCNSFSTSEDGGWTSLNSAQLLDEVFNLLDNGVKTSSLEAYLEQRPMVAVQIGLPPTQTPLLLPRANNIHRTSSASVLGAKDGDEGGWLKKKLERRKARFNAQKEAPVKLSRQIEYHQIDSSQLKIGRSLGSGATGVVYAGTYFEQEVAVKKLHPHIAVEPLAIEDFLQEAEIWKPLTFRNILQLYGVCADVGNVCMVMEIGTMSLSDLLYKEARYPDLPWSRRLNIARDVASGCLYLHSKNIVHRDIKTMNILLTQEGIVKLCDFGMTKTLTELEMEGGTEQLMGTPQWLAPEVADGETYSKAADVYSFGIVLWEIASRRLPYTTNQGLEEAPVNTLVAAISRGVRPSLHSLQYSTIPQVNDRFMALMIKCWTVPASARPSFEDIVGELSDILDLEEHRDRCKEREAQIYLRKAGEQFSKREYFLAIKALGRSMQCHTLAEAYMLLWLSHMSLEQMDEALQACERWIRDFPFSTAALIKKADIMMFQQKFPQALEAFKLAQSLDPYDVAIRRKIKDCQRNLVVEIDLDPTLLVPRKVCHRATICRTTSTAPTRAPPPLPSKRSPSTATSSVKAPQSPASPLLSSPSLPSVPTLSYPASILSASNVSPSVPSASAKERFPK